MLDATTVVHFRDPLAEGQASSYSAMMSLTLSLVRTCVTERSPIANSASGSASGTTWKVQMT